MSSQKKPRVFGRNLASPLLIINGFTNIKDSPVEDNKPKANHYNVVHLMIQNMFPPLDLARVKSQNETLRFSRLRSTTLKKLCSSIWIMNLIQLILDTMESKLTMQESIKMFV